MSSTLSDANISPLLKKLGRSDTLLGAWRAIKRNAETSGSVKSRKEAALFDEKLPTNLRSLMSRICGPSGYQFSPATGITISKGPNKPGKRPLVIAGLEDRIVQRAILDVLQGQPHLTQIQDILNTPTSVGGIPGRGVDSAIKIIQECYSNGYEFVVGSDIASFFTKIPKNRVLQFVQDAVQDDAFSELFEKALSVEISETSNLSNEERKMFPTGDDGVAQGCPLSALAGNIVLKEFDAQLNQRGRNIVCIRYIDDFIILGKKKSSVAKALMAAQETLKTLKMDIYDPVQDPSKAFSGKLGHDLQIEFLGYRLVPGLYPPSSTNIDRFKGNIRSIVGTGKKEIRNAISKPTSNKPRALAQTLDKIDNVSRGWVRSFKCNRCAKSLKNLDEFISEQISDLLGHYSERTKNLSILEKRSALGVSLMQDILCIDDCSDKPETRNKETIDSENMQEINL